MRTSKHPHGISLESFDEQLKLLPILEGITWERTEQDYSRAMEIQSAVLRAERARREGGSLPPSAFFISTEEAKNITVALSSEEQYLPYVFDFAKVAFKRLEYKDEPTGADVNEACARIESMCMSPDSREVAYLALKTIIEAMQDEAAPHDLLPLARPVSQIRVTGI